jgi:ATP-binding cassette, subfamily B, bacterial HlyB/CyaB
MRPGNDDVDAPGSPSRQRAGVSASDSAFCALAVIAAYYHIQTNPFQLAHDAGLGQRCANPGDLLRSTLRLGLKARLIHGISEKKITDVPLPAIMCLKNGGFMILAGRIPDGRVRVVDPVTQSFRDYQPTDLYAFWSGDLLLVTRRWGGAGVNPKLVGFKWIFPSLRRYHWAISHILIASVFLQVFALATPFLFQAIIDKVLIHKGLSTLTAIFIALSCLGLFECILQFVRSYTLAHTGSRIDAELGSRLFTHLLRLPMTYFETRPAGQTVARVREIETIRAFLTGQGISSLIDLVFALIFLAVLFLYSKTLALVCVSSLLLYLVISQTLRPLLKSKICERFTAGAQSQQLLIESLCGIETLKAAAVEPILRTKWEERLSAYVRTSFQSNTLSSLGQAAMQYVNKATTAVVLYLGAMEVMDGEMTIGGLVAFNMIMNQLTSPVLRLSQFWQDFQQTQVSIERLGDILNACPENINAGHVSLPPIQGAITLENVSFRYDRNGPEILKGLSLSIPPGQVIGIVGHSGSGKSTLTKLVQRFYRPDNGRVLIDGIDIAHADSAWLRRQIGVVLQENMLFNATIHENIALANPGMARGDVIKAARLVGADEFVNKLPLGFDTPIEERGANLSGGQRQRLAIARALATDPRILILDEATSALDYESEAIIQSNMRQIVKGRTVLIVAHRLAAVRHCNRIIVLLTGGIAEDGTFEELRKKPNGLFARLWGLQTEGFSSAAGFT